MSRPCPAGVALSAPQSADTGARFAALSESIKNAEAAAQAAANRSTGWLWHLLIVVLLIVLIAGEVFLAIQANEP